MDSTAPRDQDPGRKEFRTLRELREGNYNEGEVRWMLPGYLARGAITLLVGHPKSGKSTFVFGLLRAREDGSELIGRAVKKGRAVVLSEEADPSLIEKADRFGLSEDRLLFRTRLRAFPR